MAQCPSLLSGLRCQVKTNSRLSCFSAMFFCLSSSGFQHFPAESNAAQEHEKKKWLLWITKRLSAAALHLWAKIVTGWPRRLGSYSDTCVCGANLRFRRLCVACDSSRGCQVAWRKAAHMPDYRLVHQTDILLCGSLHSCRLPTQTPVSCLSVSCCVATRVPTLSQACLGHAHTHRHSAGMLSPL